MRSGGRAADAIRPLRFQRRFTASPGGSVLVDWGATRLLCTAMLEDGVPPFLVESRQGWLTAEYAMLPHATPRRRPRDVTRGRPDGRATEIQRLIGRSLRAVVDLAALPGRTLWIDCDVLQADGGTRTAAVNGAWVAVHDALSRAVEDGRLGASPLRTGLAAVSVGVVGGEAVLDLDAAEDQSADVDMNVVRTGAGEFVEVQGTAEGRTFDRGMLDRLLLLAEQGARAVIDCQRAALERPA